MVAADTKRLTLHAQKRGLAEVEPTTIWPADLPVIVQDTREQRPLPLGRSLPVVRATLYPGDYSIVGCEPGSAFAQAHRCEWAIERKESDLAWCCIGGWEDFYRRQIRPLSRLRRGVLLVCYTRQQIRAGIATTHVNVDPACILGRLDSIDAQWVQVVYADGREEAAAVVRALAWRTFRYLRPRD